MVMIYDAGGWWGQGVRFVGRASGGEVIGWWCVGGVAAMRRLSGWKEDVGWRTDEEWDGDGAEEGEEGDGCRCGCVLTVHRAWHWELCTERFYQLKLICS